MSRPEQTYNHDLCDGFNVLFSSPIAIGAAVNAAGNINLRQVQQLQETLAPETDEQSKKHD